MKRMVLVMVLGLWFVPASLAFERTANAQPLPLPERFQAWFDLKCYEPNVEAQQQIINQAVQLTQLHPLLAGSGHQVRVQNLQQLCVPVRKNGVKLPADVLPFEQFADFACYSLELVGAALPFSMKLSPLNPVLLAANPPFPSHVVTVSVPQQLCTPMMKTPQVPPPAVLRLIQSLDLECFLVTTPAFTPNVPLTLGHLNPLLVGLPNENVILPHNSKQVCLPVAKDGRLPPPDVLPIVQGVAIEKFFVTQSVVSLMPVSFGMHQLNPVFEWVPDLPITSLGSLQNRDLGLPVRIDPAGVNIDFANLSGAAANGIEIVLEGPEHVAEHVDGIFENFTFELTPEENTRLSWSSLEHSVPAGGIHHVGFKVPGPGKIHSAVWTSNGSSLGCATVLMTSGTHQVGAGGEVTFSNTVLGCEAVDLFAGDLVVEWHQTEVPLSDLRDGVDRHPFQVVDISSPVQAIPAGGSFTYELPEVPSSARFAVVTYAISKSQDLSGAARNFVQLPVQPVPTWPVPAVGGWPLLAMLAVALAATAWSLQRRAVAPARGAQHRLPTGPAR